jgi:eukaryotic-like serine/threonine-protein kinase
MSEREGTEGVDRADDGPEGTGTRVLADRYRLGEVLGKGGMGTVWRAVDETLGRAVAVKELRFPGNVDEDEKQRLVTRTLREAKATARIRNTGAITVFDVVKEDDRPWIVMELVEGRSLSDAIREDGPLTPKRAAEIGLVLLDVLKDAHREGILHRDVKPSNVLIADGGASPAGTSGPGRVVLSDFGIAQIDGDPSVTSTGMLVGAPSYISPERARGQKPGPPADLWSLGALLYACVEGRPPYDKGSAIATLTAVMTEPVGPMPHAGPLAEVIKGLLAKDPEQRLDEQGARALLRAVAYAPDRPVAPPAARSDDARTAVLPVDPQPTPTDAPPAARQAAADQARVRDALRTVRGAAAKARPVPAPEPGTPENIPAPPRAPLTEVVPRRTLIIVIAAVVLAVLATVIAVAVANSGGGGKGSHGTGKNSPTPSAPSHTGPSAKTSAPQQNATDGTDGNGNGNGKGKGKGKGGGSDDQGSASSSPGSGGTPGPGAPALPAGWYVYHDAEGFSIALPPGWKRTGNNGYDTGSTFQGSDGRKLLVDWTHSPHASALKDWQNAAANAASTMDGYQQIALHKADYRGYNAADWEYKRQQAGKQVHVLNRGMVTDADHGYAIMFTTPAGDWDSDANGLARQTFFATFKPAQ